MNCYLRAFQGLESLYFRAFRVFHNVYGLLPCRAFFHRPYVDKRIWNVTSFFESGLLFCVCIRTVTFGARVFLRKKSPEIGVVFCRILSFLDKISRGFIWKSEFCSGILYTGCYFVFFGHSAVKKNLSGGFCYWLFFLFGVIYFSSSQEVQMLP